MASRYLTGNFFRSGSYGQLTESRNFTTFDSTGSKHYTIPSKTYSGAFVIEYDSTYSGSATAIVLGNSVDVADWLGTLASRVIRLQINSIPVTTLVSKLDGKLRHVRVERDGSDNVTVTVSGFSPESIGTLAGDFTFDLVGKAGFGNGYDGIIANVDLNGERFYPIDEDWTENLVLHDTKTVLGSEEVTNGDFATDTDWTKTGTSTISGGKGNVDDGFIGQDVLTNGVTYLVECDISNFVGGGSNAITNANGLGGSLHAITGDGHITFAFTHSVASGLILFVSQSATGASFSVDNVTVKEAAGYGTAVNITSSDSETFTKAGNDWDGVQSWTNPPDIVGSDWVDDGGGQYTLTGTGGFNPIEMNTTIKINATYKVIFNKVSSNGATKLVSTSATVNISDGSLGVQTVTIFTDGALLRFSRTSGNVNAVFKDISMKRFLEGA